MLSHCTAGSDSLPTAFVSLLKMCGILRVMCNMSQSVPTQKYAASKSKQWSDIQHFVRTTSHPVIHVILHTKVVSACVSQDEAGQSRGMGTVEFQYPEDALQAINRLTNTVSSSLLMCVYSKICCKVYSKLSRAPLEL